MLEKLMKLKDSKKTSFFISLSCIILCLSMFIGNTFAWFTDSVTSGSNRIQSGNLKVSLDYRKVGFGTASSGWADAKGSEDILDPDARYEPGFVSMTLFKVQNLGSLTFKYQLALLKKGEVSGVNLDGEKFNLSDYLSFNFVKLDDSGINGSKITKTKALEASLDADAFTREDALKLVGDNANSLGYNVQNTVDAVMHTNADANATEAQKCDVIALIITMPSTVGAETMYDDAFSKPSLTLDIRLVATQYSDENEKDSFDQYYDEKAVYNDENNPVKPNWSAFQYIKGDLKNQLICYDGTGSPVVKVKTNGSHEGTLIVSECNAPIGFDVQAGDVYKSYDISFVDSYGNKIVLTDSDPYNVELFVGKDYDSVELYHNGSVMAQSDYSYDKNSGFVTFNTKTFSVFTAAAKGKSVLVLNSDNELTAKYYTIKDAFDNAPSGSMVKCTAALNILEQNVSLANNKTITFDLNGSALDVSKYGFVVNGNLEIINSANTPIVSSPSIFRNLTDASYSVLFTINQSGSLKVKDCTIDSFVKSDSYVALIKNSGELSLDNCKVDDVINGCSGSVTSQKMFIHSTKGSVNVSRSNINIKTNHSWCTGFNIGNCSLSLDSCNIIIDGTTGFGIYMNGDVSSCVMENTVLNVFAHSSNIFAIQGNDKNIDLTIKNSSIEAYNYSADQAHSTVCFKKLGLGGKVVIDSNVRFKTSSVTNKRLYVVSQCTCSFVDPYNNKVPISGSSWTNIS